MAELVYGARFRFTWSKLPCLERGVGSNPTLVIFLLLFCSSCLDLDVLNLADAFCQSWSNWAETTLVPAWTDSSDYIVWFPDYLMVSRLEVPARPACDGTGGAQR